MLRRIAAIGQDASLSANVVAKAREEHAERKKALEAEREQIHKTLRQQSRAVSEMVGQENATRQLADWQDQIQAGENRLAEIERELAALGGEISEREVRQALSRFTDLVSALTAAERCRLMELLIERVVFDREKESVALTFRPSGFEAILGEAA